MSVTLDINNALKLVLPTLRFCDLQTDTTSKKAYKENIETSNWFVNSITYLGCPNIPQMKLDSIIWWNTLLFLIFCDRKTSSYHWRLLDEVYLVCWIKQTVNVDGVPGGFQTQQYKGDWFKILCKLCDYIEVAGR